MSLSVHVVIFRFIFFTFRSISNVHLPLHNSIFVLTFLLCIFYLEKNVLTLLFHTYIDIHLLPSVHFVQLLPHFFITRVFITSPLKLF
jgi:hypothetical protein